MELAAVRRKPALRGVLHEVGFYVALAVGVALVLTSDPGLAQAASIVFAASVAACFGASALYHRPTWTPVLRTWLARLDHAGIYLLIAGTYTPVCVMVMSGRWATVTLSVVWAGALAGILVKLFWARAPKWTSAAIALALGWSGLPAAAELAKVPVVGLVLLVVGGVLYTAGAVVYVRRSPDPRPRTFGYHEVFHALTLAAAGCQYVAVAFFVLPYS